MEENSMFKQTLAIKCHTFGWTKFQVVCLHSASFQSVYSLYCHPEPAQDLMQNAR